MAPFGASRAGLMSVDRDDIPDSVVLPEADDLTHFDGDTGAFEINDDSPVIYTDENDLSLKQTSAQSIIYSTSGLETYPEAGETISCYIYEDDDGPAPLAIFGLQDSDSFYGFGPVQDRIVIKKDGITGRDETVSESADTNVEEWFDYELEWGTDGGLDLTAYEVDQETGERLSEVGSASVNDSDYDDGGVGFAGASSSGLATWDYYRVTDR